MTVLLLLAVLLLAYANGGNDNFKGVATLFGSGTAGYRVALAWGTITTLAGSLTAFLIAPRLLERFSGKGLVPDHLAAQPGYLAAVALAAGLTVLMATRIGMPISTTHALAGALAGAAIASRAGFNPSVLAKVFFAPLLVSPLAAMFGTALLSPVFRTARALAGITNASCFCV